MCSPPFEDCGLSFDTNTNSLNHMADNGRSSGLSSAAQAAISPNNRGNTSAGTDKESLAYSESEIAASNLHGRNDTMNTNFSDILKILDEENEGGSSGAPSKTQTYNSDSLPPRAKSAGNTGDNLTGLEPPHGAPVAVCVEPALSSTTIMDMPSTSLAEEYIRNSRYLLNKSTSTDAGNEEEFGSLSDMKKEEENFYQTISNEYGDDNVWGLLSGVCGNIYEWLVPFFHMLTFIHIIIFAVGDLAQVKYARGSVLSGVLFSHK